MQVVKIFISRILSLSNLIHPSDNCVSFFFLLLVSIVKLASCTNNEKERSESQLTFCKTRIRRRENTGNPFEMEFTQKG